METKILSLLLLSVLSINLFAQSAPSGGGGGGGSVPVPNDGFPPTLPIGSPELLISNAKQMVTKVVVITASRGFVSNGKSYFEKPYLPGVVGQPDLAEMAALVQVPTFTFQTRNPADPVQVYVRFQDSGGRHLFEGFASFTLVKGADGSFAPPTPDISVQVWPSGELPLNVPGADDIQVVMLNERGETVETRNLERDRRTGAFMFPSWLAGNKYVQVIATDWREDGTQVTAIYSGDGVRQAVQSGSFETSVATFGNVVIVPTDKTKVYIGSGDPQSDRAFQNGASPLVQVKLTKEALFYFYAEHPSGEIAKGFWIRFPNGFSYFPIKPESPTELHLATGVYDIIIDWPTFGRRDGSFGERNEKGGGTVVSEKG